DHGPLGAAHQLARLVLGREQRHDRASGIEVFVELARQRRAIAFAARHHHHEQVGTALQLADLRVRTLTEELDDAAEPERRRAILVAGVERAGELRAYAAPR